VYWLQMPHPVLYGIANNDTFESVQALHGLRTSHRHTNSYLYTYQILIIFE
jgi:hypothetical protein